MKNLVSEKDHEKNMSLLLFLRLRVLSASPRCCYWDRVNFNAFNAQLYPTQLCAFHRQRSRHVTRQQLTQLAFRPPFLGLFTKIQTSIWSEFSGQKGMPCFASSLLDSNRRQRALQILNGPTGQEIKILVETACEIGGQVCSPGARCL